MTKITIHYDGPIVTRQQAVENHSTHFFTKKPCKNGHIDKRSTRRGVCFECQRINRKKYYHKYKFKNKEAFKHHHALYKHRHPEMILIRAARQRARKFNIEFNITKDDVYIPEKCPCCNDKIIKPTYSKERNKRNVKTPSLDRIDNKRGYVKNNIAVICWQCNRLKCDGSLNDFKNIIRYIENYIN